MDDVGEILLVAFMIFLIAGLLIGTIGLFSSNETVAPANTTNCEHEYVTTSEYDFWLRSYRTYSKCTKCGEEF